MTMRAFLVLLVVLNLGAAAWWLLHTDPAATAPAEAASGIARLSLVSERPELRPAATPAADVPPPVDDTQAVAAATPPPPPSNDTCLRLGPFADAAAAGQAQAALRTGATRVAIREQTQPAGRDRGWRVYLPAAADRAAADAAAARLRAAGFTDLLVVGNGNGAEANSIALGRFSSEDRARQHAAALRAAGFEAKAEALGETRSAFWVELAMAGPADAAALRRRVGATQARAIDCAGPR